MFDLKNKVIVLIGGGGILGSKFADALAERGACIAIVDCDAGSASGVAKVVNTKYGNVAKAYSVDITKREELKQLSVEVVQDFGSVDVLVNNAAYKSENFFEPFETFPEEDWNQVFAVNTTGVMFACQVFGALMVKQGYGSIINTLSIYGLMAPDQRIYEGSLYEGRPINTPAIYSASKAAVWGLTKYLAAYWGDKGVRVNALTPGGIFSGQNDLFVEKYSARIPLGRMAKQDEMSGALIFLASDSASYVTGQNIMVDGGLSAW